MVSIVEFLSLFVINIISSLGYWGVFIGMTLESACIPLPSEIIMTFSGFVVWQGNTNMTLWGITLVGATGNLLGSLIAYFVGLKGGRPLLEKYGKYILITHKNLETADKWFDKYGYEAVSNKQSPTGDTDLHIPTRRNHTHEPEKIHNIHLPGITTMVLRTRLHRSPARAKMGYNKQILPHTRHNRHNRSYRIYRILNIQAQRKIFNKSLTMNQNNESINLK